MNMRARIVSAGIRRFPWMMMSTITSCWAQLDVGARQRIAKRKLSAVAQKRRPRRRFSAGLTWLWEEIGTTSNGAWMKSQLYGTGGALRKRSPHPQFLD